MGILITCDNKGCFESGEHLLNTATNEVICGSCGKVIKGVTHFMKVSMKSMGQTAHNRPVNKAFTVQCQRCGQTVKPSIARNGAIMCPCGVEMTHLPPPIAQMLRLNLGGSKE